MGASKAIVVAGLLCLAALAGVGVGVWERPKPPVDLPPDSHSMPEQVEGSIDVHVAGWVTNPGVVSVSPGAIVADAIEAAGGMRPGAHADQINLAAPVVSGLQVVVPGPDEAGSATKADGLVSLNLADEAELERLPGVGPVLAGRIVAHREENGPFASVDDLLDVPGIGEAKLSSLRDLVRP